MYFIRDLCVHVRIRAAEALGCNTLQANKSTVAKLCNQSIPPVPTASGETLQVKKCNSFGAVTFCYARMFGFCGAVVVGMRRSKISRFRSIKVTIKAKGQ